MNTNINSSSSSSSSLSSKSSSNHSNHQTVLEKKSKSNLSISSDQSNLQLKLKSNLPLSTSTTLIHHNSSNLAIPINQNFSSNTFSSPSNLLSPSSAPTILANSNHQTNSNQLNSSSNLHPIQISVETSAQDNTSVELSTHDSLVKKTFLIVNLHTKPTLPKAPSTQEPIVMKGSPDANLIHIIS
ncbi:hypothetical protein O181_076276 [Austropuccinia psidii MF-1]|uniref:Uncharacterized protein n=1 Tax=Austropuccinia psidii MF-1 TaxID=1389203 RepID=A0A9Q3IAZ4_9BASI|nr:hypothetical protein [Austropuccinia psidii MF-1]